jgi:DNA-binding NarL/FixJ family response regulator
MKTTVIFIDDDAIERQSSLDVLKEIFADTSLVIEARSPLNALGDYIDFMNQTALAALILDQRLNTSGKVLYSGVELAAQFRSIGSRIPIVILTNYPDDDFNSQGWAVECVVPKTITLRDPSGTPALQFKLRLLRQIEISANVLAAREQRFNELLIKSSREKLTSEEERELRQLEGDRISTVAAAEREKQIKLDSEIETLKKLLGRDRLL